MTDAVRYARRRDSNRRLPESGFFRSEWQTLASRPDLDDADRHTCAAGAQAGWVGVMAVVPCMLTLPISDGVGSVNIHPPIIFRCGPAGEAADSSGSGGVDIDEPATRRPSGRFASAIRPPRPWCRCGGSRLRAGVGTRCSARRGSASPNLRFLDRSADRSMAGPGREADQAGNAPGLASLHRRARTARDTI